MWANNIIWSVALNYRSFCVFFVKKFLRNHFWFWLSACPSCSLLFFEVVICNFLNRKIDFHKSKFVFWEKITDLPIWINFFLFHELQEKNFCHLLARTTEKSWSAKFQRYFCWQGNPSFRTPFNLEVSRNRSPSMAAALRLGSGIGTRRSLPSVRGLHFSSSSSSRVSFSHVLARDRRGLDGPKVRI